MTPYIETSPESLADQRERHRLTEIYWRDRAISLLGQPYPEYEAVREAVDKAQEAMIRRRLIT